MNDTTDKTTTIATGTTVYNLEGIAAEVSLKHPAECGYFVRPLYEGHDSETGPYTELGEPVYWSKVWLSPPTEVREAKIAQLDATIAEKRAELVKIQSTQYKVQSTEKEDKKRLEKLMMRSRALTRIEDFLDGKITHYVKSNSWDWQDNIGRKITITEAKKEKSGNDNRDSDLKLLTLFGRSNGSLEFMLNNWSCGGSPSDYKIVQPFCSYEEALERAKEMVTEQLAEWRAETRKWVGLDYLPDNLTRFGMEIPEDLEQAVKDHKLESKRRALADAQEKVAKAQAELADAESIVL